MDLVNWRGNTLVTCSTQLTTISVMYGNEKLIPVTDNIKLDEKSVRPTRISLASWKSWSFWETVLEKMKPYKEAIENSTLILRVQEDGATNSHIFWPAAPIAFFKALMTAIADGQLTLKQGRSKTMKLFQAYTIVKEFDGHKNVRIDWICSKREYPLVRYDEVIKGTDIPPDFKTALERHQAGEPGGEFVYAIEGIDELFSEEEVEELRRYLADTYTDAGAELHVVDAMKIPCDADTWGIRNWPSGTETGEIPLYEQDGYNLSIPIVGCYDLERNLKLWTDLPPADIEVGLTFVEYLLEALSLPADTLGDKASIQHSLATVRRDSGYFASAGKPNEAWLRAQRESLDATGFNGLAEMLTEGSGEGYPIEYDQVESTV